MTPTRMLHLFLVLVLVIFLIVMFKTNFPQNEPVQLAPDQSAAVLPTHKPDVAAQVPVPGRFVFPAPFDRYYVAMPVLWEKKPLEVTLAKGDIQTPPAPNKTPQAKHIAPAPTVVKLPWVFALP